jgi:hypothetical protein
LLQAELMGDDVSMLFRVVFVNKRLIDHCLFGVLDGG